LDETFERADDSQPDKRAKNRQTIDNDLRLTFISYVRHPLRPSVGIGSPQVRPCNPESPSGILYTNPV